MVSKETEVSIFSASDAIINRVKSPYIIIFITSWVFHNWQLITALVTLDLPYYQLVGRLEHFFNFRDLLLWPLAKSIGVYILYLVVTYLTKAAYSYTVFCISKTDDKINKRNEYLIQEAKTFRIAFFEFAQSKLLRKIYRDNDCGSSKQAESILMWKESFDDAQKETGIDSLLDHFSDTVLNNNQNSLTGDERTFAIKYDLVSLNKNAQYDLTLKGGYFIEKHEGVKSTQYPLPIRKRGEGEVSDKLMDILFSTHPPSEA